MLLVLLLLLLVVVVLAASAIPGKANASRLPSRESDAASDAATETASEQKWSCEYENRLPPGLGLTIPAAEVLTFAKYHG